MLEAGFKYFTQNKLYIWKKDSKKITNNKSKTASEDKNTTKQEYGNRVSGSKLRDLAWSLDVLDLSKNKNSNS